MIEWTDESGELNVLVLEPLMDFGLTLDRMEPHDYPGGMRYMDGSTVIEGNACRECRLPRENPVHHGEVVYR